ncbi:PREDICTED: ubiquitin carboxyl-terminal hydrolase 12-like isoform X2 [Tarenaya hassleriana]|uniref:ubiquitin carboxyl-terminal hydrolase 12-like isoform X2 n=1 Tax=Tarenaya hassleriana TaxID=28532 RepID=UPI00053C830E|nr:PREDICTED: ubiquitin carboxyl-terminal hydrolase 12-like isoform X2 [Tarenaya hassleriana]
MSSKDHPDEEKSVEPSDMAVDAVDDIADTEMLQPTAEFGGLQLTEDELQPETSGAANQTVIYNWEIRNFSQLGPEKVKSESFSAGDVKWKILLFPKGDGTDHLSLYLESENTKRFRCLDFRLTVINQIAILRSAVRELIGETIRDRCLGFKCFMPLGALLDPARDFLVDDILKVKAEVVSCKKEEDSCDMEKENGCEENEVNSGHATKEDPDERIKKGGGINDSGKDSGYLGMGNLGAEHHDKKKNSSYLGIKNQGVTCYMNSVIQTLYHIPSFRKAVYKIPTTKDEKPSESTPLALQRLFYNLQFGKTYACTMELAKSFGSRWQSFMMQDVSEFRRFLSSQLKENMKRRSRNVLEELFEVRYLEAIECLFVDYKSTTLGKAYELILPVKDSSGVYATFDDMVRPQPLDVKYQAGTLFGRQEAQRIMKFTHLPPVLQLELKRFTHGENGNTHKINDYYEFPLELDLDRCDGNYLAPEADKNIHNRYILHSVLAHIGDMNVGHYYAFIRPTLCDEWYKFNDETVTKEDGRNAIEGLFGGNNKGITVANAYMLVYVREDDKDKVMCSVGKEDIRQHLEDRFLEEQTKANRVAKQLDYEDQVEAVHFRSVAESRDEFTLYLSLSLSYDAVVGRVAQYLGVDDHSKIQLTCHDVHTQKPNFDPIRPSIAFNLHKMLHLSNEVNHFSNILYYKLLAVPSEEAEGFKTLIIKFHLPAIMDKVECQVEPHTMSMRKSGTVNDLLADLKSMVDLSCPEAKLRMFEVFCHKIYKVFSPEEKIADINDQYMTLRAEEVSEEEQNLGPKDRLIRVYNFKDAKQVKVFGDPFLLAIHEEERFADIKPRLKKKAAVSDPVFAKWKFAFLGLGNPEYLDDSDVLIRYFEQEEKDTSVAWQPFLGIHHPDDSSMDVD